jgi:xanthine dehydrogenase accessory factor
VKREVFEALVRARREQRAAVLFTELSTGQSELWCPGEPPLDPARAEAARRALATDDAFTVTPAGAPACFVQPFNPPLRLVLVGAVHIAEALAAFARIAGYEVLIVDPREAFARRDLFPGVKVLTGWPDEELEAMKLDHRAAVVTLTHDPKIDDPALEAALRSPAFYVGALGSGKTHAARLRRLAARGFDEAALRRLHGPVGLRIGGRTPAEVAVSALAEITLRLRLGAEAPSPVGSAPAAGG